MWRLEEVEAEHAVRWRGPAAPGALYGHNAAIWTCLGRGK